MLLHTWETGMERMEVEKERKWVCPVRCRPKQMCQTTEIKTLVTTAVIQVRTINCSYRLTQPQCSLTSVEKLVLGSLGHIGKLSSIVHYLKCVLKLESKNVCFLLGKFRSFSPCFSPFSPIWCLMNTTQDRPWPAASIHPFLHLISRSHCPNHAILFHTHTFSLELLFCPRGCFAIV